MGITSRGKSWEIVNSLWIAFCFFSGVSGIAFIYAGIRARRTKWIGIGLLGLAFVLFRQVVTAILETRYFGGAWGLTLSFYPIYAGFIVYAFIIRKEFLLRLDARLIEKESAAMDNQKPGNPFMNSPQTPNQPSPPAPYSGSVPVNRRQLVGKTAEFLQKAADKVSAEAQRIGGSQPARPQPPPPRRGNPFMNGRPNAYAGNVPPNPYVKNNAPPAPAARPAQAEGYIAEGRRLLAELQQTYYIIENDNLKQKIVTLYNTGKKIYDYAEKNPAVKQDLAKFGSYYLPEVIKLLRAYDEMERYEGTDNAKASMERIEGLVISMENVFTKQLDNLLSHKAIDLKADITVLEGILASDGYSGERIQVGELRIDAVNDDD